MEPVHFLWMLLLVLGLLFPVSIMQGGKFNVHGASGPIFSLINEDVILPCKIVPEREPENMAIVWARDRKNIHTFYEEWNIDKSHNNRTELFKEEFSHGNVSLKLRNVQVSDQANYTCTVGSFTLFEGTVIELQVAGFGRTPVINVFSPYEDGIKLVCKSSAWYPEPRVLWTAADGEDLQSRAETSLEIDDTGTIEVYSSVIVKSRSESALSCIIQNTLIKQERVSIIMLSDEFYPRISTWKVLFITLVIIVLVIGAVAVWKYTELNRKLKHAELSHKPKQEALEEEKERLQEGEEMKSPQEDEIMKEKEEVRKEKGEIRKKEGEIRKKEDEIRKKEDEIMKEKDEIMKEKEEVRKEKDEIRKKEELITNFFSLETIRLDPSTAHPKLLLKYNTVKHLDQLKDAPDNPHRFDSHLYVLGSERFDSGNHFWIVEVGDKTEWDLGVASDSVNRKGSITLSPANGFWVIGLCNETDYWARASSFTKLKNNDKPRWIGIFLQYELGQVSFYNAENLSHLYSFSNCTFDGVLRPFFNPGISSNGMNSMALKVIQKCFN